MMLSIFIFSCNPESVNESSTAINKDKIEPTQSSQGGN